MDDVTGEPCAANPPILCGWDRSGNFGDELAPFVIHRLTGRPVKRVSYQDLRRKLLSVGSIAHRADSTATLWGTGLISPRHLPREPPQKVLAVRGPLTADILRQNGVDVPPVYGDPALLLPHLYQPCREIRYRLGVFPHYVDTGHPWVKWISRQDGVIVIQARKRGIDVRRTVDTICSCEGVVSSSLHGLIVADAYGIPNVWVELTGRLVGRDFKFRDYAASIGRSFRAPLRIRRPIGMDRLLNVADTCQLPSFDPKPLMAAFDFESELPG